MYSHSLLSPYTGAVPLLDEEFDKADSAPVEPASANHLVLFHDRAWDDQLDEGEEVSL